MLSAALLLIRRSILVCGRLLSNRNDDSQQSVSTSRSRSRYEDAQALAAENFKHQKPLESLHVMHCICCRCNAATGTKELKDTSVACSQSYHAEHSEFKLEVGEVSRLSLRL